MIPRISQACLDVIGEGQGDWEYFAKKIVQLNEEQPELVQALTKSCAAVCSDMFEEGTDEYIFFFNNMLCLSVQTYEAVKKQIGVNILEELEGKFV